MNWKEVPHLFANGKFKGIEGYENYYVSQYGDVISTKGGIPKILSQSSNDKGYKYVNLYRNGDSKTVAVHRLVTKAFLPNPDGKSCINHKDGIKDNNHVDNLEWCTYQENNTHASKNGLYSKGEGHGLSKMTEDKVVEIRDKYKNGEYTYTNLSEIFNIDRRTVSRIINRKTWKHV